MQIHHQRSVSILKLQLSRKKGTSPVAEQYTIPLWEHYCKEMDYDFYWQKDLVHEGYPLGWNIPIIWREFVAKPKSGWKFVWFWTWDSMPVEQKIYDQNCRVLRETNLRKCLHIDPK